MKVKSIFLQTIACVAIGVFLATAIIVIKSLNADHSGHPLLSYSYPEGGTLEGRIGYADFVGEVRILGINRRYRALDFDRNTNQMILVPGSEGKFADPSNPDPMIDAAYDPLTEYDAEVVSVIGGNLAPGQRIIIRSPGHGATTPEEEKANARAGRKTEKKGDVFLYILARVADGRYVGVDGPVSRLKSVGNKLKYDLDESPVYDKDKNEIDIAQLTLITSEKLGKIKLNREMPVQDSTPSNDPQNQPARIAPTPSQ